MHLAQAARLEACFHVSRVSVGVRRKASSSSRDAPAQHVADASVRCRHVWFHGSVVVQLHELPSRVVARRECRRQSHGVQLLCAGMKLCHELTLITFVTARHAREAIFHEAPGDGLLRASRRWRIFVVVRRRRGKSQHSIEGDLPELWFTHTMHKRLWKYLTPHFSMKFFQYFHSFQFMVNLARLLPDFIQTPLNNLLAHVTILCLLLLP